MSMLRRLSVLVRVVLACVLPLAVLLTSCADPQDGAAADRGSATGHATDATSPPADDDPGSAGTPAPGFPADAIGLRVVVLHAVTGAPVAGASCVVVDAEREEHTGVTDASGAFDVRLPNTWGAEITVRRDGFVRAWSRDAHLEVGRRIEHALQLVPGRALTGTVVDARTGEALPDVRLSLRPYAPALVTASQAGPPALAEGVSDADGAFALGAAPLDVTTTLLVESFGYTAEAVTVRPSDTAPLAVSLARSGSFVGTVLGPDAQPVSGARVFAVPEELVVLLDMPEGSVESGGGELSAPSAKTDGSGRYRVDGLRVDAPYYLLAQAPEFARSELLVGKTVDGERLEAEVDLTLRLPGQLRIELLGADGKPPGGGPLLWIERGEFPPVIPVGKGAGVFVFNRLDPGAHQVHVHAADHLPLTVDATLTAGELTSMDVRLVEGARIRGLLVNDLGEPVDRGEIRAVRARAPEGESESLATTDASGAFALTGLPVGAYLLRPSAEGYDLVAPVEVAAPNTKAALVLPRGGHLGAEFALPEGATAPEWVLVQMVSSRTGGVRAQSVPWRGGKLDIGGVPTGGCTVTVLVEGFAPSTFEVDVAPGARAARGRILLDAGIAVRGVVVDAAGTPIPNAQVEIDDPVVPLSQTDVTDRRGAFELAHLAARETFVVVRAEGYLSTRVPTVPQADAAPIRVVLARGAVVRGRVRRATGGPVPDADVRIVSKGGAAFDEWVPTGALGLFELRIPAGTYLVSVSAEPSEPAQEIAVGNGAEYEVELTLR